MAKYTKLVCAVALLLLGATGAKAQTMLYRLDRPGDNDALLTGSMDEVETLLNWGWKLRGPVGKVFNTAAPFSRDPLYRLTNLSNGRKFFTIVESEKNTFVNNGWAVEAIIGYVARTAPDTNIALYRNRLPNGARNVSATSYNLTNQGSLNQSFAFDSILALSAAYIPSLTSGTYPNGGVGFDYDGGSMWLDASGMD